MGGDLHLLDQPQETKPNPMSEFFNHPAFLPALISGVATAILFSIIGGFRIDSLRTATRKREKEANQTIADLHGEETILRAKLANQRTSEVDLIKEIGELEARTKSDRQREEEMAQFLAFAKSTLQTELRKHEKVILSSAIGVSQAIPAAPKPAPVSVSAPSHAPHDDRDFVPIQNPRPTASAPAPAETPREANFEGFVIDQSSQKSESAANDLRAALDEPHS